MNVTGQDYYCYNCGVWLDMTTVETFNEAQSYCEETRLIAYALLRSSYNAEQIDRILEATYAKAMQGVEQNSVAVRRMIMAGTYVVPPDIQAAPEEKR
jgi:hypothetical protein